LYTARLNIVYAIIGKHMTLISGSVCVHGKHL
jgi:hypothetical protein